MASTYHLTHPHLLRNPQDRARKPSFTVGLGAGYAGTAGTTPCPVPPLGLPQETSVPHSPLTPAQLRGGGGLVSPKDTPTSTGSSCEATSSPQTGIPPEHEGPQQLLPQYHHPEPHRTAGGRGWKRPSTAERSRTGPQAEPHSPRNSVPSEGKPAALIWGRRPLRMRTAAPPRPAPALPPTVPPRPVPTRPWGA